MVSEDTIPLEFIAAIEKGLVGAFDSGVLIGFPVMDVKVSLIDGSCHEEESTEQAFGTAANIAFRKALEDAAPALLEPVMDVEVIAPEEYLGDVIGDLNGKRARIVGMETVGGGAQRIIAKVPLGEMFGYSTDLRSATQGRANFTMQFSEYDIVPEQISSAVVKRIRGI